MSTLLSLCQRTIVLKADAPNCCIMLSCYARKNYEKSVIHLEEL